MWQVLFDFCNKSQYINRIKLYLLFIKLVRCLNLDNLLLNVYFIKHTENLSL